jgi:hypothetical protein
MSHPTPREEFFDASSSLYRTRFWEVLGFRQPLLLEAPSLGLPRACVLVLPPGDGCGPGVLVARSFAEGRRLWSGRLPGWYRYLDYQRGDTVDPKLRKAALAHGWRVDGPDAWPDWRGPDGAADDADLITGTAVAAALAHFFIEHDDRLVFGPMTRPLTEGVRLVDVPGKPEVRLVAPHPEAPWRPHAKRVAPSRHPAWKELRTYGRAFARRRARDFPHAEELLLTLWKVHFSVGRYVDWSPDDLPRFLLDTLTRPGRGAPPGREHAPETYAAYFSALARAGAISRKTARDITASIAGVREEFLHRMEASGKKKKRGKPVLRLVR